MNILPKKLLSVVFVVILSQALSSCFFVPFIQSFKDIGATKADRMALLETRMKDFQSVWKDGKSMRILPFVERESWGNFKTHLRANRGKETIFEADVDFIDFDEDGYQAEVEVIVKYYRVPYYVVDERVEREIWNFSLKNGWQISEKEILDSVDS